MIAEAYPQIAKRIHPLTGEPTLRRPRSKDLGSMAAGSTHHVIKASYDAARTTDEFKNYWANADALDADSANSKAVRQRLVQRSRYEVGSNGYADGMVQTYANYLVGIGPSLRLQTGSTGFNQMVEREWSRWSKAVQLRRKLWCMAHAKVQDGEAFAMIRNNPRLRHPIGIDLVLFETEQCQTPRLPYNVPGYIDGIIFDEFGNPEFYDVLKYHPGGQFNGSIVSIYGEPERIPAKFILHWYMLRRPGQHRGVPEFKSTLNVGASSRRWREATVGAAETAAEFTAVLQTAFQPDEMDAVTPMSTLDIQKRMMTALPAGQALSQMRAEHPNATYEAFHEAQISEQARPKNMPLNIAKCDSSKYNYASGRLDHQTFFSALDVERQDGNDLVLDPLFALWFEQASLFYGWVGNPQSPPLYSWDWPKHPVADIVSEANSTDTRLKNGSESLTKVYANEGRDYADEIQQLANDYGVSEDEAKQMIRQAVFNAQNQQAGMMQAENQSTGATTNG